MNNQQINLTISQFHQAALDGKKATQAMSDLGHLLASELVYTKTLLDRVQLMATPESPIGRACRGQPEI